VRVIDCEQNSPEWYAARAGMPTASEFATVMRTKGKGDDGTSKERRTYLHKLAGEILTGLPSESYSNGFMERGKALEPEARNLYAFMHDAEPELVGFIVNDALRCGCSPDSLVGKAGALEIKSCLPHIQIDRLLRNTLPSEHRAQVQGVMWVAEREWADFASYCPNLPLFVIRVHRDEAFIKDLAASVAQFNAELAETVERIRRMGGMAEAA
jgi:hypothetical protein